MNADPAAQQRLLDLQAQDTALAQLAHRRNSIAELAVIADAETRLTGLEADVVRAETEAGDLDRAQKRLETDVEQVRQRSERDQRRMQSGQVPAKELANLQHEVQSLARRQSELEDGVLELMEQREAVEGRLGDLRAEVTKVAADKETATASRDFAWAGIDAESATRDATRRALAADLPADLLALYEKVRQANGGVGAAALKQRRCEGCRLELAGSELRAARSAPPDEVLRCENCRRILIRTPDSGL